MWKACAAIPALLAGVVAEHAYGQEAMYTQAATMPAKGNWILRSQIHFWDL
jgi:hypothetical protein